MTIRHLHVKAGATERIPNSLAIPCLRKVLNEQGIRAAVIFLNSLTDHRYTSVFFFDGPYGRHVQFYDRHNPEQLTAPDILIEMSYCVYVKTSAALFAVDDAQLDERVDADHPKRESIRSYCGIPLLDSEGTVLGSACHYDPEAKAISPADVELLELFGEMVPRE